MFNKLKTKQIIKRLSKIDKRKVFVLPPEKINSILVITNSNISLIESQLKNFFPHSNYYFLTPRQQKEDQSTGNQYTFHSTDLGFRNFKNERLNQLLKQNFEVLIDYNKNSCELDFFIKIIDNHLICGHSNSEKNYLYDIFLYGDNLIENLYKQLNKLTHNEHK
jgi:hypothetical protein